MTKRFLWMFIPFQVPFVIMCLTMLTLLVSRVSADEVTYQYDKLGRLIKVIYEDGPQFYYYYDKAGNRIEKQVTAPKSCGDVVTTNYNYTFTHDWTCGGGHGLVIGGGDTTIDGNGYILDGGGTGQGLVIGPDSMTGSETDTAEENPVIGDLSLPDEKCQPATTPEDVKDMPKKDTKPAEIASASPVSSPEPKAPTIDEHQAVIHPKDLKRVIPVETKPDEANITIDERDNVLTYHLKGNESACARMIIGIPAIGVDLERAHISGKPGRKRFRVNKVYPGTFAEKAGIKPGDIILTFNRMEVKNIDQITRLLRDYKEGEKVELKILRDNKIMEIVVAIPLLAKEEK